MVAVHAEEGKQPKDTDVQVIVIWHDDEDEPGRIMNMQRIDATDNSSSHASS